MSGTNDSGNGAAIHQPVSRISVASIRLSQDFVGMAGVKKELTTVRMKKPGKHDWFRVHPDEAYRIPALACIHLKDDDNEYYVVAPGLVPELENELTYVSLYTVVNRHNVVSLWPIPLPPRDGRKDNDWWMSARDAAQRAMADWTRITANRALGAYEILRAPPGLPDPEWPSDKSLDDLLNIALGQGYFVDSLEHALVKKLRGVA